MGPAYLQPPWWRSPVVEYWESVTQRNEFHTCKPKIFMFALDHLPTVPLCENDGIKYHLIEWIYVTDTVNVHANDIDKILEPTESMFTSCNH